MYLKGLWLCCGSEAFKCVVIRKYLTRRKSSRQYLLIVFVMGSTCESASAKWNTKASRIRAFSAGALLGEGPHESRIPKGVIFYNPSAENAKNADGDIPAHHRESYWIPRVAS